MNKGMSEEVHDVYRGTSGAGNGMGMGLHRERDKCRVG